jgi:hypothetical protein
MNKPMRARPTQVEVFNRELDQIIRGGAASGENYSPEEARALQLAQNLVTADFSGGSAIRQSLRRRFSKGALWRVLVWLYYWRSFWFLGFYLRSMSPPHPLILAWLPRLPCQINR